MTSLTNNKHSQRLVWLLLAMSVLLIGWRFSRAHHLVTRLEATRFAQEHYYTLWTDSNRLADTPQRWQAVNLVERDSDRIALELEGARDMEDEIVDLLGGRLAEAIVLGDISTGASNDLERATKIAHDMVTKYGMSDAIGPVNYSDADEVFLGRDFTSKQNYSEDLASKIDKEVRRIMDAAYDRGKKILEEHRAELDRVAGALLELETLGEEEFEAVYTGASTPAEIAEANGLKAKVRKEKEDREAEERKKREEEESKASQEDKIAEAIKSGKRVAVIDRKGNFEILKDMADEFMKNPDDEDEDEWEDEKEPSSAEDDDKEE